MLVSHGGLDVCSHGLAPFEISVLGDRRTAPAVSELQEDKRGTSLPPTSLLHSFLISFLITDFFWCLEPAAAF